MLSHLWSRRGDDRGIGIVEIMVAMLIFGVVVVSLIPFLVNTYRVTVRNTTIASATQSLNEQIELARGAAGSCAEFDAFLASSVTARSDGRDQPMYVTRSVLSAASCTTDPLRKIRIQVHEKNASGPVLAETVAIITVPAR